MSLDKRLLIRNRILDLAIKGQEGHIGSSFSIVELLVGLFGHELNVVSPENFVLSKGHAAIALYAALIEFDFLNALHFANFASKNSKFGGHPGKMSDPVSIPYSTGSLGHGIALAAGLAFANRLLRPESKQKIYCLVGDGELNEGTIWETLLLIQKFKLSNLVIIIDDNSSSSRAINLGDIEKKLISFGQNVLCIDGHNLYEINLAIEDAQASELPSTILAKTKKGYGSTVTVGNFSWHHRIPTENEISQIVAGYYL
jgi:transketolase